MFILNNAWEKYLESMVAITRSYTRLSMNKSQLNAPVRTGCVSKTPFSWAHRRPTITSGLVQTRSGFVRRRGLGNQLTWLGTKNASTKPADKTDGCAVLELLQDPSQALCPYCCAPHPERTHSRRSRHLLGVCGTGANAVSSSSSRQNEHHRLEQEQ